MTDDSQSGRAAAFGEIMIQAEGLSKYYGPFVATKDVSFSVPRRQVAGFLGPNGAGKSTTMKMLTGYLAPSEGSAKIGGFNVTTERIEASRLIGYLPENGPLYLEMTPRGLLQYLGEARGVAASGDLESRLHYVREMCALEDVWNKPIGKLSRGYRQRVGMAHSLLHDPDVLILDEPTSGLDPNQVLGVRKLIRDLGASKTILLSTHILQEVRAVCDRVILISEGRIVFDGLTQEMGSTQDEMEKRFRELTRAEAA